MSASFELDPTERLTAGAVGEPGERTFFIQAEAAGTLVTLLAEKEQVRLLAEAATQLLGQLPPGDEGDAPVGEVLELTPPLTPEWRVGEMSIEFDEERNRVAIVLNEVVNDDDEDETDEELGLARFVVTRAQVRAMAEHALDVVAAGRPRCQLCGFPMAPDGDHVCPASNGHRAPRA